ncbi:MAG: ribonuclease HII [Magnetococcales bacterium]|nr:ribonuclease HII [Magnetococcales bacterium]
MAKAPPPLPDLQLERQALQQGYRLVCGVDEVGRGPLAGPVVAAAVVLPLHGETLDALVGLNDSKQLSAGKRQLFLSRIQATALGIQVGMATVREIDRLNIRQASLLAMSRAVAGLALAVDAFVLVDGRDLPADLPCPGRAIVRGDQHSLSIAAASVVAKERRDALMVELATQAPGYGWEHNSGYPTAEHLQALRRLGVTEHHRQSFAPVRQLLEMAGSR